MAMKRHSSNKVKTLKMDASATKQTRKVIASDRNSVASIRFGKPNAEKPRSEVLRRVVPGGADFNDKTDADEMNGTRRTNRNKRLNANMKTVAIHGPTEGETVPTRASDSPSSDIK